MTESYPDLQIEALTELLIHLVTQLPGLENIAGHADLDTRMQSCEDNPDIMIRRKLDPGPRFPWSDLMAKIQLARLAPGEL